MTFRLKIWVVLLTAFFCTAGSLYAQYIMGMNPCVLCIVQRVALLCIAVFSLLCLLLPLSKRWAVHLTTLFVSIPTLGGLATAAYQIWLQSLPLDQQPSCGSPWSFRLRHMPLFDWYEPLIRGTGNCGIVERIVGIPLPMISAIVFCSVLIWLWLAWWKHR